MSKLPERGFVQLGNYWKHYFIYWYDGQYMTKCWYCGDNRLFKYRKALINYSIKHQHRVRKMKAAKT